jgi:type VI secretion system protein ImpI/type VI secretion system protein
MLSHLAPDRLLRELPPSAADALPGRRRQRAWEAYEKLHARLTDNLGGGPDQVFDRAFMRAYEAALEDLEGTDDDPSETTPSTRNTP